MEKNLQLDRLVFFCDAVVAIAITLLVFNLKLDGNFRHLTFAELVGAWQKFVAFFLSFMSIAIFWTIHHNFYSYIKKIDAKMRLYNLGWLFFIVTIPFSASLISSYLSDPPAIFVYSLNIFLVTLFQNQIWDYAAVQPAFLKEEIPPMVIRHYRLSCNVAMINALLAIGMSFFSPLTAFILLFMRLPMIAIAKRIFKIK
jgi:uncharacterized membrane protein